MNTQTVDIKPISFEQTYPIRQEILRPNRALETCFFDGDSLKTTFHFGSFVNQELVGIISVFKNDNANFSEKEQYQIRGMAVLETHQKYGLGKKLVAHCETFLKTINTPLIWFNAREVAVNFYKKQGYEIIGSAFEIPDVGPHYVMWKKI